MQNLRPPAVTLMRRVEPPAVTPSAFSVVVSPTPPSLICDADVVAHAAACDGVSESQRVDSRWLSGCDSMACHSLWYSFRSTIRCFAVAFALPQKLPLQRRHLPRLTKICHWKSAAKRIIPGIVISAATIPDEITDTTLISIGHEPSRSCTSTSQSSSGPSNCMQRTRISSTSEFIRICTVCARVNEPCPRKQTADSTRVPALAAEPRPLVPRVDAG